MKTMLLALSLLCLAGCGGMTRAVGVLPQTTDDLARKSETFRKPAPPGESAAARTP